MELEKISIHAWIQANQIKTENGKPLDFNNHRYLYDIYSDSSKYLCCLKAGQIGFSTMAILKTIWLARNHKMDIGYILPTVEMVQKFVGSKVNRLAQQNPIIEKWFKEKDSISQKQIDENYVFYLGAQTDRSAIMLTLDMLVADEYDKAPQEILEIYDSRLQHSKYGYKWVFSNPTIPEFGVDRFWLKSDMKKWHIKHSCGKEYIMDEGCINYVSEMYQCPHCQNVITREEIRMGEWKPTAVGEWSGYWIPLWINPMIEAKKICVHKKEKSREYFYNFVAGLPYVNPNDAINQRILDNCLTDEINQRLSRTIIGLDTGHSLHYTMMNREGIFYYGYCPSVAESNIKGYDPYDEIDKILAEDKNAILISDQGGDLIGVRKLQAKYTGRVYLCWFVKETRNQQLIRWGDGDEWGKVLVDRNRAVQLAVDQLNEARIQFNGSKEDWQDYFNHWLNMYRVKEIEIGTENDPAYSWRWVWKRKGPDHWALATIYGLVGMDRFAEELAEIIHKDKFMAGVPIGSRADGVITGRRLGVRVDI